MIVANPCFGLDIVAVVEVRREIIRARNLGVAILLLSEDPDEILELSDRIVVIFNGRLVYETAIADVDLTVIGQRMDDH